MLFLLLNIIFALAFLAFTYLNLNDYDAWLWVPVYLIATICCGLAAFKIYYPVVYIGSVIFYLTYSLLLFFWKDGVLDWIIKYKTPSITETMQATKPYIERTREFFGLLIISGALIMNYVVAVYQTKH
ncbi:transmembrane 220 family protein [Mucilaginibacter agri]|uniref:Transmembrane family 220, helix n=1 Tax=Mucilaginibacter agri TaxID=2695265 RepID=A0A966DXL4_9SPHI|nr:transmembrane 220 family protein [Mucilaginibacter agri]NCD72384.1 hypothetical protein [Mucilaginibacter agri]